MRYLCIDLGDKRTGLAVGDDASRLVMPVGVVETPIAAGGGAELLAALVRATAEHLGAPAELCPPGRGSIGVPPGGQSSAGAPKTSSHGKILVGLPLNMDGTEGPRAKSVRAFAARVGAATGREVVFHDERLSTAAADWSMARSGLTRDQKKSKRDALAAAAILSEFLNAAAEPPPDPAAPPDQTNPAGRDVYRGGGDEDDDP